MTWTLAKEVRLRAWRAVEAIAGWADDVKYRFWKRFQNGSADLHAALTAVLDAQDSLDAIDSAIQDGDYSAALRLINISRESLKEHIETFRGIM